MAQIIARAQEVVSEYTRAPQETRVRHDILTLQSWYEEGNKKPLSDLLRAWQGIQQVEYSDYFSFFTIAGYHGEPFRGAGWGNPQWWGGYCNHGNVLFPVWHRAYLYRLENALRRIPGCEDVTLPYWNEVGKQPKETAVPWAFLKDSIELDDGKTIVNPLRSYVFQHQVSDNLMPPEIVGASPTDPSPPKANEQILNPIYNKAPGYKTCRYPFDGFNTDAANAYNAEQTQKGQAATDAALCQNVWQWINVSPNVRNSYQTCLKAPTYTVFSNTTSASQWNEDHPEQHIVPLESPHNDIHLAVGGYNVSSDNDFDQADSALANGDMGENNTASFDPIFFFHHCFVDKIFWDWQLGHTNTDGTPCVDKLEVEDLYPGTNSVDNQGPTPGVAGNTWLDMNSQLLPFKHGDRPNGAVMTGKDVFNIKSQLHYDYAPPYTHKSLGAIPAAPEPAPLKPTVHAHVYGVNRNSIAGSFIIAAYKQDVKTKEKTLMGIESVLSRWATAGCANCQNHTQVKAHIPLHGLDISEITGSNPKYEIVAQVVTRPVIKGNKNIPQPKIVAVPLKPAAKA